MIAATALRLFAEIWQAGLPVRLIGVGVSGLSAEASQATLWESTGPEVEQRRQVEAILLEVRARFGEGIIGWGREWKRAR